MILCEFFEKWHYFSLELAVYNTVWWIGNYCHPLVELQFWAKDRITIYMDKYLNNSILPPPHTNYITKYYYTEYNTFYA